LVLGSFQKGGASRFGALSGYDDTVGAQVLVEAMDLVGGNS
jgi:hypothetical protein